ncbi:hypothetical protein V1292_005020 [Bradyrhizobium sp. AZCC 1719]|uniref:hypothetical protein n=1 Tax=Bradyrhizobium sp. AZCC 1719 TaxID=3117028 RepID=UPI002FEFD347
MTLVARIMLGGAPCLIGDALLSSPDLANPYVTGAECELPLVGEINSLLAAKKRPFRTKLCQKLHVFEGRLAVGWSANDHRQAERALRVLREVAKKPNVTGADVQEELSAIDPDQIKDLSLVGNLLQAVNGDEIRCTTFGCNIIAESVAGFGEVQAAGSGARTFIGMLQRSGPLPSTANDVSAVLPVLGTLLNYELSTAQSIEERWGGAFETVGFSQRTGRLEKLDNVLHTFWMWRDDGTIDFQPRFYLARYFDDLLVLRSAEYETHGSPAHGRNPIKRLKSNKVRLVPSLLKEVMDGDLVKIGHVDFSYDYICCHVWFRGAQGRVTPRAAMVVGGRRGGLYDIDLSVAENGSLHLNVPSDTVRNVYEEAKQTAATGFDVGLNCADSAFN